MSKVPIDLDLGPSDDGDWVKFKLEGFKTHVVHKSIFPDLFADLKRRGAGRTEFARRVRKYEFYIPSNVMNWPERRFSVDSLEVTVNVNDLGSMLDATRFLPFRFFTGGASYRKLHSRYDCLVLTPDQQTAVLCALEMERASAARAAWEHIGVEEN